jgi:probable rRNA maturation factor
MGLHTDTVHPHLRLDSRTVRRLKELTEEALRQHGLSEWSVSMTFVDDPFIQKLNRTYLKKDRPTDVLAFPIDEPGLSNKGSENVLGDIYVSLDRAKEQGAEYSVPFSIEVTRLALHGLYHLMGYSHEAMASVIEAHLSRLEEG